MAKVPGLTNAQTTDLLHIVGVATFGGSVLITWATAIWALDHGGTATGWTPPNTILGIGAACVAGGVANGKFCPDEDNH